MGKCWNANGFPVPTRYELQYFGRALVDDIAVVMTLLFSLYG